MALYTYRALTREGKRTSGTLEATSVQEVRDRLVKMQLLPVEVLLAKQAGAASWWEWIKQSFSRRVSLQDTIFFTKQLAVLLRAGVPLLDALELLIEQTEKSLRTIVIDLKDAVKEGRSFADALNDFPRTFNTTYVQLVRAGEASGRLEIILERLVEQMERSYELRKRVSGAMRLPLIQLGIVVMVVVVLLTQVVPQIQAVFQEQGGALPLSSRILIALSDFMVNYYLWLLGVLILFAALFYAWKSSDSGARTWDWAMLNMPVFGYFVRMRAIVEFCSTLGMLVEAGVNLSEALKIVSRVIDNRIIVDALQAASEKIVKQGKITIYLKEAKIFPAVALYLIKTGEESGQLAQMLLTVARTYDAELREAADNLSTRLNPIMIVVMGGIVGFIVMAIGSPMMKMTDVIKESTRMTRNV
jgi:type II secretory pathway component PulF